jgi:crotonobetainyl-CoA:carnitine CoA-transferase CaiB-like acyl-CoA transferase
MESPPGALTGFRVLDLCDAKGVLCTKSMADLGANVMIIELPEGAVARSHGPSYHNQVHPERSRFFWYFHANKRSITPHQRAGVRRPVWDNTTPLCMANCSA